MKVLFIGGSGNISSACTERAIEKGMEVFHLNRGSSQNLMPDEVRLLKADVRNRSEVENALQNMTFDTVVNWIGFEASHVGTDIDIFRNRTKQYIFISSASVYQTPPARLPVTESTPLENPFWQYSRDKIACERAAMDAYEKNSFPVTIVRPSHTYGKTFVPLPGRFTNIGRMQAGKPIIIHGDGTSIWPLTHTTDFAKGFVGLLGNEEAIGEDFHITSDELLTWNQIFETIAKTAGLTPEIIHIASDFINQIDPEFGAGLLGDKAISMIFDNSKIKKFVPEFKATIPFEEGIKETIEWHLADPSRQVIDQKRSKSIDRIIEQYNLLSQ